MYDEEVGYDVIAAQFIDGFYAFAVITRRYLRIYTITNDLRVAPKWIQDFVFDLDCTVVSFMQTEILP